MCYGRRDADASVRTCRTRARARRIKEEKVQLARSIGSGVRRYRGFATSRRSIRLVRAFRREQIDPAYFYGVIADDTVAQISAFAPLSGAFVLDVGGGPGYFRSAFTSAGSRYVAVDADRAELSAADRPHDETVLGSGMELPLRTGSVDVCFSSNVLEHVPNPERMADEMVRVTRPGGLVYLSYTLWLSPWGGHETSPWHYVGGRYAADRYAKRHGHPPKNRYGTSLYALSGARMLRWSARAARSGRVEVLGAFPRYLPTWTYWLTLVPGLGGFALWNLVLVLRRR
jgi:SAM-dependent methyltransferase